MIYEFKWKAGGSYTINAEQVNVEGDLIKALEEAKVNNAPLRIRGQELRMNELESIEIYFNKKLENNQIVNK